MIKSKIYLRLSNVSSSKPEVHRTIYRDINDLLDPVKLGITAHYFNHDSVPLYFQLTGLGTNYTFGTVNMGILSAGANAYKNCDEIASRPKPSVSELSNGEMIENIALILKAYTDSGYTHLKWGFSRSVSVYWINSADPAFTIDELDNFDDGTVDGWSIRGIAPYFSSVGIDIASDYVLSVPLSCKGVIDRHVFSTGDTYWATGEIYKSFTTPNKSKVFAVFDLRFGYYYPDLSGVPYDPWIWLFKDTDILIYLEYMTRNKWIRIVVPLPSNITLALALRSQGALCISGMPIGGAEFYNNVWLDNFKLISK